MFGSTATNVCSEAPALIPDDGHEDDNHPDHKCRKGAEESPPLTNEIAAKPYCGKGREYQKTPRRCKVEAESEASVKLTDTCSKRPKHMVIFAQGVCGSVNCVPRLRRRTDTI